MKLYSELTTNIMKLMLIILIAVAAVSTLATLAYIIDIDFYIDYAYDVDNFAGIMQLVIFYINLIVFLVWIYRVHVDMKSLFPNHSRGPGGALACVMIPIYNLFYGISSTFLRIGKSMQSLPAASTPGRIIGVLAIPLTIIIWVTNAVERSVQRQDSPNEYVLLLSGILDIVLFTVYLTICLQVALGLRQALSSRIATTEAAALAVGDESAGDTIEEIETASEDQVAATESESAVTTGLSLDKRPSE
ncbi:DUF4328 domain-containing protein [Cohnella soli]|uniref:DUF4328 domain-containing protein n=1 Tax=Cohnella soli TaxID=425005 RepID=A0ABW0HNF4_9BACL